MATAAWHHSPSHRRARLLVTVVLAVLGALLGATLGLLRPPSATATTTILIDPLDGNPFSTSTRGDNLTNLGTEAQLVGSSDVISRVIAKTGTALTPDVLHSALTVDVPTNTQLMEISVSTRRAEAAVTLSQAFAEQFLLARKDRAMTQSNAQIDSLETEIAERQKERTSLTGALVTAGASEVATLQSQIDSVNTQIVSLQSRVAQLRAGPFSPGQIVSPAASEPAPLWRFWPVLAALGGLAGLAAGVAVALLRRQAHGRAIVRAPRVLGALSDEDLAATTPPSQAARTTALAILTTERRRPFVILIVSATEAPPVTADALAVAIAATEHRSVIVDVAGASKVPSVAGLPDLLAGSRPVPDLDEMVTSIAPGDIASMEDLLLSPRMSAIVDELLLRADVVLLAATGQSSYATKALADIADRVVVEAPSPDQAEAGWGESLLGIVLVPRPADGQTPGAREP